MSEDLDITLKLHLHPLLAWYGVRRRIRGPGGKELLVEVPAGIRNKTRLRLKGEGKRLGNCQGNLYLEVQIKRSNFRLLQRGLLALGSVALGSLLIWRLSSSPFYDVWLVLGYLLIVTGVIVISGIFWGEYLDKRGVSVLVFLFLCGFPALIMNDFLLDIAFPWSAAFTCATIGGTVGGLLMCPRPMLSGLIGGFLAGNIALAAVYYYTLHRVTVWNYEIAVLLAIGSLPGFGVGWLLKKALSSHTSNK